MITDYWYITEDEYTPEPKIVSGKGAIGNDNGKYKYDVSIVSGDLIDAEMQHKLELFDNKQAQIILESENIVQAYNDFVQLKIDSLISLSKNKLKDSELSVILRNFIATYNTMDRAFPNSARVKKDITEMFIYQNQDPQYIRSLLETRLKYASTTQKILREIIQKNAEILKLSSAQVQTLISASSSPKDMRDAIAKNEKEFIKNEYLADCRSIGAGVFITGKEFEIGSENVKFANYIQDLCNYDLVVLAHGVDSANTNEGILKKAKDYALERLYKMLDFYSITKDQANKYADEIMRDIKKYNEFLPYRDNDSKRYFSQIMGRKYDELFSKFNSDGKWIFQYPIKFIDGKSYTDIEQFIRSAKKQGFKKIKMYSCNPGAHDLPADIKAGVVFSKRTNFAENTIITESQVQENPYLKGAYELENLALQLCAENSIDYNDDQYLIECMNTESLNITYISEGRLYDIFFKLVDFIKRIIAAIIGFIKKIVHFVASLLGKIKDFLTHKDQRKMKNRFINLTTITLESAKLEKNKVSSQEEIYAIIQKNMNSVCIEYKKVAGKQAKINKQLQQQLEQKAKKAQNEYAINFGNQVLNELF